MRTICSEDRTLPLPSLYRRQPQVGAKSDAWFYSVDFDWEIRESESNPRWYRTYHLHRVTLGEERMLFVRTPQELADFHDRYRAGAFPGAARHEYEARQICWAAVASEWDGVEIAPLMGLRKVEPYIQWYGSWECSMGAVWRPRGLRAERVAWAYPVRPEEAAVPEEEAPAQDGDAVFTRPAGLREASYKFSIRELMAGPRAAGLTEEFIEEYMRQLRDMHGGAVPPPLDTDYGRREEYARMKMRELDGIKLVPPEWTVSYEAAAEKEKKP